MNTQRYIVTRFPAPAAFETNGRQGFTLVELLVALVLLNVGLVSLVALSAAISRAGDDTRANARAFGAASARLERMASVSCAALLSGFATPFAGATETFSDTPGPNDTRALRDSVTFLIPGFTRNIVVETRARC